MEENTRRPQNPRRRRKSQIEIIKEAYLPTVFLIITVILVAVFIIGGAVRNAEPKETLPPVDTTPQPSVDIYAEQAQQLLAQAEQLAKEFDYKAAAALIDTFSGDITAYPALTAKKQEYLQLDANMISWANPSQITTLSFHNLIADPSRAFTNKAYGTSYNKNFVTIGEFSAILQQLYDKGYILVRLSDFTTCETLDGGQTQCASKELKLPVGKKPLVLVQTNANYYTYMVDGDGDGKADKDGAGFANRMVVDGNGNITCEMVDAAGNTVTGAYDLVPILEQFIDAHPDFSYKGARAILAPSGYDGIFGYRTDAATKTEKGENYFNEQVEGAKALVTALKNKGYEMACYTYGNVEYGTIGASEIQADLRSWTAEVTPVLGQTNILVYAKDSEITEYSGSKFNVLQNAGFRYYLGFTTGTSGGTLGKDYILQKRLCVTGSNMANTNIYSSLFDAASILDTTRGNVPS